MEGKAGKKYEFTKKEVFTLETALTYYNLMIVKDDTNEFIQKLIHKVHLMLNEVK